MSTSCDLNVHQLPWAGGIPWECSHAIIDCRAVSNVACKQVDKHWHSDMCRIIRAYKPLLLVYMYVHVLPCTLYCIAVSQLYMYIYVYVYIVLLGMITCVLSPPLSGNWEQNDRAEPRTHHGPQRSP